MVGISWGAAHLADIALYQGGDREQTLIEGAKREGEVMVYTSMPADDVAALGAIFEKRYGVTVKSWRVDSESFLQRITTESQSGHYAVDVIHGASTALEALYRENLLQEVISPYQNDLIPGALPPHRQWATMAVNAIVQSYNTSLLSRQKLPKTYYDLLKPEWKGKLGIEADDFDWFAQIVTELGQPEGLKLFHDIVATNGISVRKGHSLLNNLVVAGEVELALTTYRFAVDQIKEKGAPIDWIGIPPIVARSVPVAVAKNAPHPYAAVLFYDFLLGDAQSIMADRHYDLANRNIETPISKLPIKLIDAGTMLDNAARWEQAYQSTIVNPRR